ncbi:MAG: nicotinamide mononucleotide transporter [Deltaproteobacteria bacterium]|nr:nicotinamide mononucleotide transporter [Deltaproteobacteria bacterium]
MAPHSDRQTDLRTSPYARIDLAWLLFLMSLGSGLSAVLATSVFDLSVFLSGILCVGLIAIGRREGYLIGLYNSLAYAILAYRNGLYGEVYLNLFFFVPTGIIGYLLWRRHTTASQTVAMRPLSGLQRALIAAVCMVCTVALGQVLQRNPSQNTPFIDAGTNVLSVVATLLMMGRYKEQWLLYILLNVISIGMWGLRVSAGGESSDLMVLMWSLFLLNALFGYWRWHQGTKRAAAFQKNPENTAERACDAV